MKANFTIGKKQIILSALIVILGGAIYINYIYADKENSGVPITETLNQTEENSIASEGEEDDNVKNYGDTQLVNGTVGDTYFEEAALEKTKSRDEAVETVKSVLENAEATDEELAEATAKIVELSQQISQENKMESLIKAKGFENCMVYLDEDSVDVVVETSGLTVEQAAQIKNIVLSEKDVAQENISITEVE